MKRWLRRIGVALLAIAVCLTLASVAYNAATPGGVAAAMLYAGPYVEAGGTLLAYRRWGTHGPPIVLIGGFIEPSWVWHEVGPLLSRTHRVYAVDLPPFGYSQRRGPFTLAHWTQLIEAFETRLDIHRPVVVGHSLGAAVAVSLATEAPQDVSGIVLLDGDALPGSSGPGFFSHLLVPPWFTSIFRIATGWDWLFRKGLRGAWGKTPAPFTNAFLDEWERPFRVAGTASAFISMLGHGIQGVSPATIAHVQVPRLVVWGADDTVDSVSAGKHTAALMHARFLLVSDAGHLSMLANPAAVARDIASVR